MSDRVLFRLTGLTVSLGLSICGLGLWLTAQGVGA